MRSERRRKTIRGAANVLIAAGTLLLADATATLVWQEPVTAIIAEIRQGELEDDLRDLQQAGPSPLELEALAGLRAGTGRMAFLARSLRRRTEPGDAIGRIRIRSVKIDKVVVDGTQSGDLRRGPGFYEKLGLPGSGVTIGIAGHRTTYGAPFRRLDDVDRGDEVEVTMPYGDFTYRVEETRIVKPTDLSVLDRRPYERLVLTACHPLFSAAKRIVVFARLVRGVPRGAALRGSSS